MSFGNDDGPPIPKRPLEGGDPNDRGDKRHRLRGPEDSGSGRDDAVQPAPPPPPLQQLQQLDNAENEAEDAPPVVVVLPCGQPAVINDVSAHVVGTHSPGWYDSQGASTPAVVRLAIQETHPLVPYQGTGTVSVAVGNASLFADSTCMVPVVGAFSAAALRGTVSVYVRGDAVGNVTVRLQLSPDASPGVRVVVPQVNPNVAIQPVNVVAPTVVVQQATAWLDDARVTPARARLGIHESVGEPRYPGRGTARVAGIGALFANEGCEQPLGELGADALRQGVTVYLKGTTAGNLTVELTLAAVHDSGLRVAGPASGGAVVRQVNVVAPLVVVEHIGWYHAQRSTPARVKLALKESVGEPAFEGRGRPTVREGRATLYSDEGCERVLGDLTADALRKGVPVFVKGDASGEVQIELDLTPVDDPGQRIAAAARAAVMIRPVNVVTPTVRVDSADAWVHAQHFTAARVTLGLQESTGEPRYDGRGTAVVAAGHAALFSDDQCQHGLGPLSADQLRVGVQVYVRSTAVGGVTVQLALDAVDDPRIIVSAPATGNATARGVNVITATIQCDELVLVHQNNHARPTDLSRLVLGIRQSDAAYPCADLRIRLRYGNQIVCFSDAPATHAVNTGATYAPAAIPAMIYMRGAQGGDCDLDVDLQGTAGPAYVFAPAARKTVRVERIELVADTYNVGRSVHADNPLGAPKTRELHASDAVPRSFTLARMSVTAPSNGFWAKADQVILTHANLDMFNDAPGTHAAAATLVQGDFAAPVMRYIATQGAPAWDALAAAGGLPAARNPTRVVTQRLVSLGARIRAGASADGNARTLRFGDVVRLDTFSFDQHLDRTVGNECRTRVTAPVAPLATDVALARAGAHRWYGRLSAYGVNHNHQAAHGSPFTGFVASMNIPGNNNTWATAGANFVQTFLLNEHGIGLHASMYTRIRNHIFAVLTGATHIPHADQAPNGTPRQFWGFSALYGVPGSHAECLAVNELANAGILLPDITVATYMLQFQAGRQGRPFLACPNCSGILAAPGGVRVITG